MSAAGLQVCGAGAWKTGMMALHSFHLTQHGHSLVPQHTLADVRPRTRDSMGARLTQCLPCSRAITNGWNMLDQCACPRHNWEAGVGTLMVHGPLCQMGMSFSRIVSLDEKDHHPASQAEPTPTFHLPLGAASARG